MIPAIVTVLAFATVGAIHSEAQARGGPSTESDIFITALLYALATIVSLVAWLIWSLT